MKNNMLNFDTKITVLLNQINYAKMLKNEYKNNYINNPNFKGIFNDDYFEKENKILKNLLRDLKTNCI